MTLLNPTYLWGLLALAVPVAIHLWSKRKVRTIKVGSTQFISETQSQQSRSIKLNEWWLLVLRCAVIALLVFILTEPRLTTTPQKEEVVYVFEPSLVASEEGLEKFKTIPTEHRRLLAPGLPIWEPNQDIDFTVEHTNYWQLAQEMDEIPADSIVVFTHAFARNIKGKRPATSGGIRWVGVDIEQPTSEVIQARKVEDSIELLEIASDGKYLAFAKAKKAPSLLKNTIGYQGDSLKILSGAKEKWIAIKERAPLEIALVYDDSLAGQTMFFEAAFRAIGTYSDTEIKTTQIKSTEFTEIPEEHYLVWLSNLTMPSVSNQTLGLRLDIFARYLIDPGVKPNRSYLTEMLSTQNTVDGHLAEELLKWLDLNKSISTDIAAYDQRKIDITQLETQKATEKTSTEKIMTADISNVLWVILSLFLIAERAFARYRKQ